MSNRHEIDEVRWGIVGVNGLYTGQWLTRRDAIAGHTAALAFVDEPEVSEFVSGALTPEHKRIWARCRKNGDRAVRLHIRELKD